MAREPFKTAVRVDGTKLSTRITQPGMEQLLNDNLKRQRGAGNSSHRKWSARIPELTREQWKREGREDLLKGDRRALEKYVASPEGRVFSTMPRGKNRGFSCGGI